MSTLATITRAIRRARLRMAEQDLAWMEEIGMHNLMAQRARVSSLRMALHGTTSSADIAAEASRRMRAPLLQGARP